MKKAGLMLMLTVLLAGCAGQQLAMLEAMNDPPAVNPGDEAMVSVRVIDRKGVVDEVTATVMEYRDMVIQLNDEGEQGDIVAGDGVWSYRFSVPYEAPTGEYHWEFNAYDSSGHPVSIMTKEGEEAPLTAETVVEVM